MQFRSTANQNITVYVEQRCGSGCCSWSERDTDYVREGEIFEPDFDYSAYMRTDETCFYNEVEEGNFVPVDAEAVEWFENFQS